MTTNEKDTLRENIKKLQFELDNEKFEKLEDTYETSQTLWEIEKLFRKLITQLNKIETT